MRLFRPTFSFHTASRSLAMMAMLVMLVGKLVHLGQVCTDCCGDGHCHVAASKSEASKPCPFGCQHHGEDNHETGGEEQDSPANGHDEHQCAVCSVLSQATEGPAIVGLPDESQLVVDSVFVASHSAIQGAFFRAHPRGPPASV